VEDFAPPKSAFTIRLRDSDRRVPVKAGMVSQNPGSLVADLKSRQYSA